MYDYAFNMLRQQAVMTLLESISIVTGQELVRGSHCSISFLYSAPLSSCPSVLPASLGMTHITHLYHTDFCHSGGKFPLPELNLVNVSRCMCFMTTSTHRGKESLTELNDVFPTTHLE